jgi:hypothetical protein
MDRKYGQRGYMDNGGQDRGRERDSERPREKPKGKPKGALRDVPRNVKMPGFQELLRCSLCGAIVPPPVEIGYESQCPKCRADLHACKNCRHFDTAAQFECTQHLRERITKKDVRNRCELFVAKTSIERETRDSGGGNSSPSVSPTNASDARNAR